LRRFLLSQEEEEEEEEESPHEVHRKNNSRFGVSDVRAATGCNHHSVGFGVIGELSTAYPGYDSVIGPENATVGDSAVFDPHCNLTLRSPGWHGHRLIS
jgi:hypothetical protein